MHARVYAYVLVSACLSMYLSLTVRTTLIIYGCIDVHTQRSLTLRHMPRSLTLRHIIRIHIGKIAEDTWRAFMTCLGSDDDAQLKVLSIAAHALCVGFSTMVDIRFSCLEHTPTGRHTASSSSTRPQTQT